MPIYTRRGDSGKTQLIDGREVEKDNEIVEAYGTIDELNSLLGLAKCKIEGQEIIEKIEEVQKDLFVLGVEVSGGAKQYKTITYSEVSKLEKWIDEYEGQMPPLTNFIIPGGCKEAALLHLARTVCRRAERSVTKALKKEKIRAEVLVYLNRLSDLLFILARWINYKKRINEEVWKGKKLL